LTCFGGRAARADAPGQADKEKFFEDKIRPVLVERCYECHSQEKKKVKGKFRVDDFDVMLKGGESGKRGIVPGKPDESELYLAISYTDKDTDNHDALLMPPMKNGKPRKLPDEVVANFKKWIEDGACYPKGEVKSEVKPAAIAPQRHWAFVAPREPAIPGVKQGSWPKNAVDRFILAKLEAQNLHPSAPADKRTLIRRATFDLTGLPPTEQEVQAFLSDTSPKAFEIVVDRLLASPRYGERWGRYWLDVARYSDTKGYVFEEERRYPYSYTYRDWVINAFNSDLPYDRFLTLQLAADKVDLHGDNRALAAEGFLTLGRRFLNVLPDIVDDRIDVVCRGTMALTVGCARCHDHKFDPIKQTDYYALYAVFANSPEPKEPPQIGQPEDSPQYREYKKQLDEKEAAFEKYRDQKLAEHAVAVRDPKVIAGCLLAAHFEGKPEALEYTKQPGVVHWIIARWSDYLLKCAHRQDRVFAAWRAYASLPADQFAAKSPEVTRQIQADASKMNPLVVKAFVEAPTSLQEVAERYGKLLASYDGDQPLKGFPEENLRLVLRGPVAPTLIPTEHYENVFFTPERDHVRKLRRDADAFKATNPAAPPHAMSVEDAKTIAEQHVFLRGNPGNLGARVQPAFLATLSGGKPAVFTNGSGRLELAQHIASKDNPLTARVMVNRVWLHHFGKGIVRTPSDFGMRSDPPTHPQLLDYLALRFMGNGWSIKKLHRLIMLSATYQQSSTIDPAAAKADADNKYLSHFNRQRLDWEATRDALLMASGRLDTSKIGGRPIEDLESNRRTVYQFVDRQNLPGVFRSFDFATPDTTSPQRFTTTVPQQALFMMNSSFAVQQAQALVQRPEVVAETDISRRVRQLYRVLFQREPSAEEISLGAQFITASSASEDDTAVWSYGFGEYDSAKRQLRSFVPFAHFTGETWQVSTKFPHPKFAYVSLTAGGGHPGADLKHAAVRRWTSPIDGVIKINGTVGHHEDQGDGIGAHIISSRRGELASWNVFHMEASTDVDQVQVKKGDTIDFVVECRGSDLCDSFSWAPVVRVASPAVAGNDGPAAWSAAEGFAGPATKPLDAWVKYAQVLLESNEFVFVD
jgi:hypothetical protein